MEPGCVHIGAGAEEKQNLGVLRFCYSTASELPLASGQSHHSTHSGSKWVLVPPGVSHGSFHFFSVTSPWADFLRRVSSFANSASWQELEPASHFFLAFLDFLYVVMGNFNLTEK